jgi:hypothetical protein
VLCSFILSSPLFCFLTFIKSRPFSNYQVTVFIKIWIVNFEILNMKWPVLMWLRYNFSKEKSLSHRSASLPANHSRHLSLRVIFDRKLYREVFLSYEIGRFLCNIYAFITFYHRRKK